MKSATTKKQFLLIILGFTFLSTNAQIPDCPTDNNGDGITNTQDFLNLVGQFGQSCIPVGQISSLGCATVTNNGNLVQGFSANAVNSVIQYSGGNNGSHSGQVVSSTGVTGLTATLLEGTFANGTGNLTYIITGTPVGFGSANFALSIGGQSCTLTRTVSEYTTASTCGAPSIHNLNKTYGSMTDQDGNVYKTIAIGNQLWMAENLKTNRYRDGSVIPTIVDQGQWSGLTTGASGWFFNDSASFSCPYGKLYNYYAVSDSRNICPTGWHVPTDAEWTTLSDFLGGTTLAGGKMKSIDTQYWSSPNTAATNESGFSALPAGFREKGSGGFGTYLDIYTTSNWWSSQGSRIRLSNNSSSYSTTNSSVSTQKFGYSVRCLSDFSPLNTIGCSNSVNAGTLTQGVQASGVTSTIPYTTANGGTHTGQVVTSTGVTGLTATLAPGTFANGSGVLVYTITGVPNDGGVASFAINIGGKTCTLTRNVIPISNATCGATNVHNSTKTYGTLTDIDGNLYKTIIIGTQEWMAENLKTSRYRNGDLIPVVTDGNQWASGITGKTCWYNNDSATYNCPYGKLYNYYTVTDTRNVCPTGWHVPSDPEWTTLFTFLGGTSVAGGKLKTTGTQYWTTNTTATNESGFSAIPGGQRNNNGGTNTFSNLGIWASWWSTTETSSTNAWYIFLNSNASTAKQAWSKQYGFYVRCLRD